MYAHANVMAACWWNCFEPDESPFVRVRGNAFCFRKQTHCIQTANGGYHFQCYCQCFIPESGRAFYPTKMSFMSMHLLPSTRCICLACWWTFCWCGHVPASLLHQWCHPWWWCHKWIRQWPIRLVVPGRHESPMVCTPWWRSKESRESLAGAPQISVLLRRATWGEQLQAMHCTAADGHVSAMFCSPEGKQLCW